MLGVEIATAGIIFVLSALSFAVIANEFILEKEDGFDAVVYNSFTPFISQANTHIAIFFSFLGSAWFLVPVYLLTIFLLAKAKKMRYAILTAAISAISILSGLGIKLIFQRPRPLLPLVTGVYGYSFPSGHSITGFTFSGLAIYFIWQQNLLRYQKWLLTAGFCVLGVFIGISRIYLRVHYASDVLGGFLITCAWLCIFFIFKHTTRRINR